MVKNFVCTGKLFLHKLFNKHYFRMLIDEKGIPINDYGYINGVYVGRQRSIVAVAEKGLDYWNKYQLGATNDRVLLSYDWEKYPENKENIPKNATSARRMFLNCADWLLEHATSCGDYSIWKYRYLSFYNVKPGCRSSQAQAEGIQLLMRAYKLKGNHKYLKCAEQSVLAFYVSVENGGVTDKNLPDGWWYDKFADIGCKRPKVLNGMMFALLGLYDFYERANNNDAKLLFDRGIIALKNSLSKYDAVNWSYYNRLGKLASDHYHKIHIWQLDLLHNITNEPIFKKYYFRWSHIKGFKHRK